MAAALLAGLCACANKAADPAPRGAGLKSDRVPLEIVFRKAGIVT